MNDEMLQTLENLAIRWDTEAHKHHTIPDKWPLDAGECCSRCDCAEQLRRVLDNPSRNNAGSQTS